MRFCDYIEMIYNATGTDERKNAFALRFLKEISEGYDWNSVNDNTFRSLVNGNRGSTNLLKDLDVYICEDSFKKFFSEYLDDDKKFLEQFNQHYFDVDCYMKDGDSITYVLFKLYRSTYTDKKK